MSAEVRKSLRARDAIAFTAFCVAAVWIGATGRVEAWPEQLVPAYLLTRGFRLYRDIKFAHAPLLIEGFALAFRWVGFKTAVLRAAALAPGLAVLVLVWNSLGRRGTRLPARSAAAAFVLVTVPLWRSLAIYPDPVLAILAIPLLDSLIGGRPNGDARAGWIAGICVAIKQTALLAALFAAAVVFVRRGPREGARFVLRLIFPTLVFGIAFLLSGAGGDFFRWTVTVPLFVYRGRTTLAPTAADLTMLLPGLLPAAALWLVPRERIPIFEKFVATGLLLSFSALAFPKFEFLHLAATIPLLAWMAGRSLDGGMPLALPTWVTGTGVALNAILFASSPSPGGVAFWSSKTDDAAVEWLSRQPPAPLFLYGVDQNLLIRSGRVPPGRLYNNPDLWYHYLAEGLERRQIDVLRSNPDSIILRGREVATGDAGGALARFLSEGYESAGVAAPGAVWLSPKGHIRTPDAAGPEPPAARLPASR
jgi:hypothetical protein